MDIKSYLSVVMGALVVATTSASADSLKMQWSDNGHFYQRFDNSDVTWHGAESECKKLGGHLASITSVEENYFIKNSLLSESYRYSNYFVGGTDANNGNWRWSDGERWSYENWYSYEPDGNTGEDYLTMSGDTGLWYDTYAYEKSYGYVCEWSGSYRVGSTTVDDMNGNQQPELAVLYTNAKNSGFSVKVKDSKTRKAVTTNFIASTGIYKPYDLSTLEDMNGNGKPEVAVLTKQYNLDKPYVLVKDLQSNDMIKRFAAFSVGYEPVSISTIPDRNGNGSAELSILAVKAGRGKVEIRDSKSGRLLSSMPF